MAQRKAVTTKQDEWETVAGDAWETVSGGEVAPADAPEDSYAALRRLIPTPPGLARGIAKGAANTGLTLTGGMAKVLGTDPTGSIRALRSETAPAPGNMGEQLGFLGEQTAEYFAPGGLVKRVGKAASALPRVARGAVRAGAEGAATGGVAAAQGHSPRAIGTAALLGAATPAALAVAERVGPAIVNNMLRPLAKQYRFGKNPGRAVVNEGIVAQDINHLVTALAERKDMVGKLIDGSLRSPRAQAAGTIDIKPMLKPVDDAIKKYARSPENEALVKQLYNFRESLTNIFIPGPKGTILPTGIPRPTMLDPYRATRVKREIGEGTKWSGEAYERPLNEVKAEVYRSIDSAVDALVPESKFLNERYGNLLEAQKAAERKAAASQLINMTDLAGFGVGTAAGGPVVGAGAAAASRALLGTTLGTTGLAQGTRAAAKGVKPLRNLLAAYDR